MSEGHHPAYGKIWCWLLIFTVAEVAAALYVTDPLAKGILLVGMALTKVILVALYFMHLKFERTTLLVIAFTPMIICAYFLFMLVPDLSGLGRTSEIRAEMPHATEKSH